MSFNMLFERSFYSCTFFAAIISDFHSLCLPNNRWYSDFVTNQPKPGRWEIDLVSRAPTLQLEPVDHQETGMETGIEPGSLTRLPSFLRSYCKRRYQWQFIVLSLSPLNLMQSVQQTVCNGTREWLQSPLNSNHLLKTDGNRRCVWSFDCKPCVCIHTNEILP